MKLGACNYCGSNHEGKCPMVKAIEYYQDGTVKRVEFITSKDHHPIQFGQLPSSTLTWGGAA